MTKTKATKEVAKKTKAPKKVVAKKSTKNVKETNTEQLIEELNKQDAEIAELRRELYNADQRAVRSNEYSAELVVKIQKIERELEIAENSIKELVNEKITIDSELVTKQILIDRLTSLVRELNGNKPIIDKDRVIVSTSIREQEFEVPTNLSKWERFSLWAKFKKWMND